MWQIWMWLMMMQTVSSFMTGQSLCMTCSGRESVQLLNAHWKPQKISDTIVSFSGLDQYVRAHLKLQEDGSFGILQPSSEEIGGYNLFIVYENDIYLDIRSCVFASDALEAYDKRRELYRLREWYQNLKPGCNIKIDGHFLID